MGYLKYLKLMNRMNAVTQVPQPPVPQFEKFCRLFVTDEEYDIMMGMKLRGNTEAELRALAALCHRRGIHVVSAPFSCCIWSP